jgi:hypothetical protein
MTGIANKEITIKLASNQVNILLPLDTLSYSIDNSG